MGAYMTGSRSLLCSFYFIHLVARDHKFDEASNMKLILTIFEQLSGLKINYHKSELFCFGEAKEVESDYMNIFGCQVAQTPQLIWEYRYTIRE